MFFRLRHINEAKSLSNKRFGKETWQLDKEEKIQYAIENCRRIRITYDDKKGGKGKNTRYLLPLVYGITKNGKKAVRAFQTAGSTKRGTPKYKLFLYDNINQVDVGKIKYYDYEQQLMSTGFNDAGDKGFSDIYSITPLAKKFNSANLANQNQPIDSSPITKDDITKEKTNSETEMPKTSPVKKTITPKTSTFQPKQQNSLGKTVDNLSNKDNFIKKIEAPDTEPVTKQEIETDNDVENMAQQNTQAPLNTGDETEPVSKSDIEPKIDPNNKLSNSYRDMMNRMDNLYNDEEDEEENLK